MCDIFATVMDPTPASPREDGIWGKVEFPTLKRSGNQGCVHSVAGTSRDGKEVHTIWSRPGAACNNDRRRDTSASASALEDRQAGNPPSGDPLPTCGIEDDDVAAQFDEGGEFEVLW